MSFMGKIKNTVEYFRANIYNARSSYEVWKMIYYARSSSVVGDEMSKKYTEIQKNHNDFFCIAEQSFLLTFVILIAHVFEKRDDSFSLKRVDEQRYNNFYKNNKETVDSIMAIRHKIFAHKDKTINNFAVPSIEELDNFFNNVQTFYNEISSKKDNSTTWFDYDNLKHAMESLYKNLYRGESMRLINIDIKYFWEHSENIISRKI